jgi:broad specificity phosphatase PhoE
VAGIRHAQAQGALIRSLIGEAGDYTVVSSPLGRARMTAEIICRTASIRKLKVEDVFSLEP